MITSWIRNFVSTFLPGGGPESVGQGAQAFEKKARAKLIDITDGVYLAEEARKRSRELLTTIRRGGATFDRLKLWINVRRKVKKNVADFYDMPEILDEITEKIVETAREDPFYRKLFS